MRLATLALGAAVALLTLNAVSSLAVSWMRYDLRHGTPRAHFYTEAAWNDCAAMSRQAQQQGARYWTCHRPDS